MTVLAVFILNVEVEPSSAKTAREAEGRISVAPSGVNLPGQFSASPRAESPELIPPRLGTFSKRQARGRLSNDQRAGSSAVSGDVGRGALHVPRPSRPFAEERS